MKKIIHAIKQKWPDLLLEIVVIILGIVIALMIDSWQENIRENKLNKEFQERLLNDLKIDINNISSVIEIYHSKKENIDSILMLLNDDPKMESGKIGTILQGMLKVNPTFYPVVGNFQSAVATGKLEYIDDKDLLNKIVGLYDFYSRIKYNGEIDDDRWFQLRDKYISVLRSGTLSLEERELIEFKDDLHAYLVGVEFYYKRCQDVKSEIKLLINDLELE